MLIVPWSAGHLLNALEDSIISSTAEVPADRIWTVFQRKSDGEI
jgi:hypothetical protein